MAGNREMVFGHFHLNLDPVNKKNNCRAVFNFRDTGRAGFLRETKVIGFYKEEDRV